MFFQISKKDYLIQIFHQTVTVRRLQRDVVYLCWPIESKCGGKCTVLELISASLSNESYKWNNDAFHIYLCFMVMLWIILVIFMKGRLTLFEQTSRSVYNCHLLTDSNGQPCFGIKWWAPYCDADVAGSTIKYQTFLHKYWRSFTRGRMFKLLRSPGGDSRE